jgi:hypothetical protein
MPLQYSPGEIPLQKLEVEICHSKLSVPLSMPFSSLERITV